MAIIGIDLAVTSAHKALVVDDRGGSCGGVISVHSTPEELQALLDQALESSGPQEPVRVVMEATGLAWLPVANFFRQRGAVVYLVNPRESADLGKYFKRHAKSDRRDCAVLARMPLINPDLKPWRMAGAKHLAGQRLCRQQDRMTRCMTECKNRIRTWETQFWPGLEEAVGDPFSPWMRRFRQEWYDPWLLASADPKRLAAWLSEAGVRYQEVDGLAARLQVVARQCMGTMGTREGDKSPDFDYSYLQCEVLRELGFLAAFEAQERPIREQIRGLYRAVHPSRNLESIPGIGEQSASVFVFFVHDVKRFGSQGEFRAWTGMIPRSSQSSNVEKKGLRLTQAGPSLVKAYAYLCAESARRWDPQIAAIYYDQMVNKGKHHTQAVCACATHLMDRVRTVLREDKPYELRDVDGRPVSKKEAREIIAERYTVPDAVRQQTNQRARKAREEKREEDKEKRRSRRRTKGADVGTSPQPGQASPPPYLCILPQYPGAVKCPRPARPHESPASTGYSVVKVPYKEPTPLDMT